MKKISALLLLLIAFPLFAAPYTPKKLGPIRHIENFSSYEIGKFPTHFRTYPFQRDRATQVYRVAEQGNNKFLHAEDVKDLSVQVLRKFDWDIKRWPNFSWRWRAKTLPKGASEKDPSTNDSACGVYVIFGGYSGPVVKYVWSSTLPAGSIIEKKPGQSYSIVLESGSKNVGSWKSAAINVAEDYEKIFKKKSDKDPAGFALLTDGNATHTPSACDYDDFTISEKKLSSLED